MICDPAATHPPAVRNPATDAHGSDVEPASTLPAGCARSDVSSVGTFAPSVVSRARSSHVCVVLSGVAPTNFSVEPGALATVRYTLRCSTKLFPIGRFLSTICRKTDVLTVGGGAPRPALGNVSLYTVAPSGTAPTYRNPAPPDRR